MEPIAWCRELAAAANRALPELAGACVHGSVALGGFVPGRSDVDLLFVCNRQQDRRALEKFAHALTSFPGCPGSGIESSLLTLEEAASTVAGRFQLHVCTGPGAKVVFGAGHPGDLDLVLHALVGRAAGIALLGPPPSTVFGVPPDAVVLARLVSELEWALGEGAGPYAVLNACRALLWAEERTVASKVAGGAWALARLPEHSALIERALAAQRDHASSRLEDQDQVFVREVIGRLAASESAG
jgi:hypothetical protein